MSMTIAFSLAKCKTKAAYSAKLKQRQVLDLKNIAQKYTVILETPILLVIKEQGVEIIVHHYGEIMFKNCDKVAFMEKAAQQIYHWGIT